MRYDHKGRCVVLSPKSVVDHTSDFQRPTSITSLDYTYTSKHLLLIIREQYYNKVSRLFQKSYFQS